VASFFAGWALSLDYIITIAISAFFVPHYMGAFFPALRHNPGDIIGGIVVVVLLAALNIRGLKESAKLNLFLAITDLVTQVGIIALGAALTLHPDVLVNQVHLGVAPSYTQLLFAVSISMIAYTGIETVSNMAEEAQRPAEQVPRTVNYVLFAVLGIFAGISIISISALPVTHHAGHYSTALGTRFENDPVLGIVSAFHLHGGLDKAAHYYVGILAATILIIATNAGMIGISRLSWSLAEHRQLPEIFTRVHGRYRTPWFTILFFSAIAVLLLIPGKTDFLGNLYSFGAMLSFTTAHVAIIALRLQDPDRERPYRAPWNIEFGGRPVPMTAVVGAVGTFAAFCSVVVLHDEARYVGTGWMVAGMSGYFLYRRRHRLDPRRQYRIPRPTPPPGFTEVSYRSALVPIWGDDVDAEAMLTAMKLLGPDGVVDAAYFLRVPSHLPLDAEMPDEEQLARNVLERARLRARAAGARVTVSMVRTRDPGEAIVTEALKRGSEMIYISAIHGPRAERALGPTTRYVLGKRPCRVVIEGAHSDGARPIPGARATPLSRP
jgi:basic amino acid/polyamine antiporter, APA family